MVRVRCLPAPARVESGVLARVPRLHGNPPAVGARDALLLLCVLYFGVLLGLSAYGPAPAASRGPLSPEPAPRSSRAQEVAALTDRDLPPVTIQLRSSTSRRSRRGCSMPSRRWTTRATSWRSRCSTTRRTRRRASSARTSSGCARCGLDAVYLHRVDRVGYKAGALDAGLKIAKGELVAIFDADFIPQPDFVRSIVGHFDGPDGSAWCRRAGAT